MENRNPDLRTSARPKPQTNLLAPPTPDVDGELENENTEVSPILNKDVVKNNAKTPLPWRQLILVYCLRAVKPLMFELIFPFVSKYSVFILNYPVLEI